MIRSNLSLLLALLLCLPGCAMRRDRAAASQQPGVALRVVCFNIRVSTAPDRPNAWVHRRDAVAAMLHAIDADVIGMQEATRVQMDDLLERLDEYAWVGVGRLGEDEGELCPVFYRHDRYELLAHGTFWLSENPHQPGIGWDAAYPRIATWAKLQHRRQDLQLLLLNTHLDNRGETARVEAAKLIRQRLEELVHDEPTIVTADLNSQPDTQPYNVLTTGRGALRDAVRSSDEGHAGSVETFTGFWGSGRTPRVIDYIFVNDHVRVVRTQTIEQWQGRQLSDHLALVADLQVPLGNGMSP